MVKKKISDFQQAIKKIAHFISVDIWRLSLKDLSYWKTVLITQLRIVILALRGIQEDKVMLRASALTFYSIFSIVPAVALAFSIAGGLGLEAYLEQQLQIALAGREEVFHWIMELTETFLAEINEGTLAVVGLAALIYTVGKLLAHMEKSFNEIWQVGKGRRWIRKFTDYLTIILIAPLFFIIAGAITIYLNTQAREVEITLLSPLLLFLVRLLPYILIWIVLTLLYIVMPNTSVPFTSALAAGIVAGTIFQLVQWAYLSLQILASGYSTMYGSFAALPLLLVWMQVSWIVVLFGAELSFANHNVEKYEFEADIKNISPFNKKVLSLYILHLLVANFQKGEKALTPKQISNNLEIPNSLVRSILNELEAVELIVETRADRTKESTYQPALDIQQITVQMALQRLDHRGTDILIAKPTSTLRNLKKILADFYSLLGQADSNKLLKDL
jgi:membrane protein